jgi:GNAT superfamily N-acetyltransferase
MFQIKQMRSKDFVFSTELANTMDWNMTPEDFRFMLQLEPEGCFILFESSKQVGIATCVSYNEVGWFGNLIINEEYRKKGAGTLLVKHAIAYLHGKGVVTIGLYAYPHLVNFYSKLGFIEDEDFAVLRAEHLCSEADVTTLPSVGKLQIPAINRFDCRCFGGNRRRLLESIILEDRNLCFYISAGDKLAGYVAATVYEKTAWVGPLICKAGEVDVADLLVRAVLSKLDGKTVYTVLPKESTIVDTFFRAGFKEDFSVRRMFLGAVVAKNCIYLAESLERG